MKDKNFMSFMVFMVKNKNQQIRRFLFFQFRNIAEEIQGFRVL